MWPAPELERKLFNVRNGLHATRRTHGQLLAAELNRPAVRIFDILANRLGHFAERHADALGLFGIGLNDDLLLIAALRVDLGHVRRRA